MRSTYEGNGYSHCGLADQDEERAYQASRVVQIPEAILTEIDFSGLHCDNCRGAMERYVHHRIATGGALRAILENDLFKAMSRLDLDHRDALYSTVKWIYNELPSGMYGDEWKVQEWLDNEPLA